MLRLYLDTNLLLKIDNYPLLKEKLSIYSDYLNIVYSSAHIDDLTRSTKDDLVKKDLKQIKHYCEDQCLAKYWGEENLNYDIRDPFEFYSTCKETTIDIENPLDFLDQECEKLGIENPLTKLNDLGPLIDVDSLQNKEELRSLTFNKFKTDFTFKSLLNDITELIKIQGSSNEFLKSTRDQIDAQLPRKVIANVKGSIIDYFNKELPKTAYNKTFDEFVIDSLKIRFNDKPYTHFDWFVTRYNTLDLFGYKSDNKSTTPNIVTDAFHSYYATHCDIFLSQDERLREKSTVLFNDGNIDTFIFSEEEFCRQIDSLIYKGNDPSLLSSLINHINGLDYEHHYCDLHSKTTITEYTLNFFFAGCFNYVIWLTSQDGVNMISFVKESKTLSNWYYLKEMKSMIKVFAEWLGADTNNNLDFVDHAYEFPGDANWIGRKWFVGTLFLSLSKEDELGFVFRIQTMKD